MKLGIAAFAVAAACSVAGTANACSVGKRPANTAAERIEGRSDLRRVTGEFRIERIEPSNDYHRPSRVIGHVTTRRGSSFAVAYLYNEIWVDCLIYYLPRADASGVFYLSRRRRDAMHELVDWSGEYVAGNVIVYSGPEGEQ